MVEQELFDFLKIKEQFGFESVQSVVNYILNMYGMDVDVINFYKNENIETIRETKLLKLLKFLKSHNKTLVDLLSDEHLNDEKIQKIVSVINAEWAIRHIENPSEEIQFLMIEHCTDLSWHMIKNITKRANWMAVGRTLELKSLPKW